MSKRVFEARFPRLVAALPLLIATLCAALITAAGLAAVTFADTLQSPHFKIDESTIDSGGLIQSNSSHFQGSESIGDAAIDNSSSTNFQINAGFTTTKDPALSVAITNANAVFPSFSPTAASTATSAFQVSDYTSYGYSVQVIGNPPSNGNHTITAMASTDVSQPGIEQFGINVVHNTSPTTFGADPDHGLFGVGSPTANYGTANSYRYVDGESIVSAPKSSGVTTYTISYIVNVNSLTPGGEYTSDQSLVCVATY